MNKFGHTSFQVSKMTNGVAVGIGVDQDGSVELPLVDVEKHHRSVDRSGVNRGEMGGNVNMYHVRGEDVDPRQARQAAEAVLKRANQGNHINYNDENKNNVNGSLYDQASAMRSSGHYQVDDYSFSTINIHNVPKASDDMAQQPDRKKSRIEGSLLLSKMPKWFAGLAPGVTNESIGYNPPHNITSDTNIAPPIRGSSQDWWSTTPKVTFDAGYGGNGGKKNSRWNRLSSAQKIGAGVTWVALMCTLMGVTISELNKSNKSNDNGQSSSATGFMPVMDFVTDMPTAIPSLGPTMMPVTSRPTRAPVTRSPVSGYSYIHGKVS